MNTPMNLNTWEAPSIDIAQIERELSRLWMSEMQGFRGAGQGFRTSVCNLVVYATGRSSESMVAPIIADLTHSHPIRAIILDAEVSDAEPTLDASIIPHCHAGGDGPPLCSEQITIVARGSSATHTSSVVSPLLLPDLPTILWWPGDPPVDAGFFREMAALADRLIVDSGDFVNWRQDLRILNGLNLRKQPRCPVSDFAWARCDRWRTEMTQFFDPREFWPCLASVSQLDIAYAIAKKNSTEPRGAPSHALLFAAWFISRLNGLPASSLQEEKDGTVRWRSTVAGHDLIVTLHPKVSPDVLPGALVSVVLAALKDGKPIEFSLQREQQDDAACIAGAIRAEGVRQHTRPPIGPEDSATLLAYDLAYASHDSLYDEALAAAVALIETQPAARR